MHHPIVRSLRLAAALLTGLALAAPATAAVVDITVTVQNLAPADSISFAPLHLGFHGGSFDAFDLGGVATEPIISVAEGGAGGAWQAAFAAADPTAVRGTVGGLLLPGATASLTLRVDSSVNRMFSFAGMVVPSNDFFIGNDNPLAYRVLDASGALALSSVTVRASDIWDAGSEVFDPSAAAFVGNNDARTPQASVVAFNFAELAAFNSLTTGAGYTFHSGLAAASEVYRIGFAVTPVPEPGSFAMLAGGLLGIGSLLVRRRTGLQGAMSAA